MIIGGVASSGCINLRTGKILVSDIIISMQYILLSLDPKITCISISWLLWWNHQASTSSYFTKYGLPVLFLYLLTFVLLFQCINGYCTVYNYIQKKYREGEKDIRCIHLEGEEGKGNSEKKVITPKFAKNLLDVTSSCTFHSILN